MTNARNPMLASANCAPHPPAGSHDEFLARRHAERAPRVCSREAKLTSSFLPAECVVRTPNEDASIFASSSSPTASHDEFLARRHAQRVPRVCFTHAKLTSSLDLPADRDSDHQVEVVCTLVQNEDTAGESSCVPTSAPARASAASQLGATLQRPRSLHRVASLRRASWPFPPVNTRAFFGAFFFRRTCSL